MGTLTSVSWYDGSLSAMSSRKTKAHKCIRNSPNSNGEAPGFCFTTVVTLASEQSLSAGSMVSMVSRTPYSSTNEPQPLLHETKPFCFIFSDSKRHNKL